MDGQRSGQWDFIDNTDPEAMGQGFKRHPIRGTLVLIHLTNIIPQGFVKDLIGGGVKGPMGG